MALNLSFIGRVWPFDHSLFKRQRTGKETEPSGYRHPYLGDGEAWPGDTRFAYEKAHELGVDAFDMDVHIRKEGVIALMYDQGVTRSTGSTKLFESLGFAELIRKRPMENKVVIAATSRSRSPTTRRSPSASGS